MGLCKGKFFINPTAPPLVVEKMAHLLPCINFNGLQQRKIFFHSTAFGTKTAKLISRMFWIGSIFQQEFCQIDELAMQNEDDLFGEAGGTIATERSNCWPTIYSSQNSAP